MNDLALRMSLSMAATGRAIDALYRAGVLTRREDGIDRRIKRIGLTTRGQSVIATIMQVRSQGAERLVAALDDTERAALERAVLNRPKWRFSDAGHNQQNLTPLLMSELLESSKPSDWRPLDPENTLYLELNSQRVVIELAPAFVPEHVANIKLLARERYWDGLAVIRVNDNYVVQLGDPNAEKPDQAEHWRGRLEAARALDRFFAVG